MYTELPRRLSRHVWAYLLLQLCVFILAIVNLSLSHWFSYCWWDFGLFTSHSFYDYDSQFASVTSISEVKSQVCDQQPARDFVQNFCPSFCSYVDNFEAAGIMMLCFALLGLVFTLVVIGLHLVLLFKRRSGQEYENELIVMWQVLPSLAYFIAFTLYLMACNLGYLEKVHTNDLESGTEPINPEFGPGLSMGIAVTALFVLVTVYGLVTTRKEF